MSILHLRCSRWGAVELMAGQVIALNGSFPVWMVAVFSFCGVAVINTEATLAFSAIPTMSSLLTWADFGKKGNHVSRRKRLTESGWDGQKLTPTFKDFRGGRYYPPLSQPRTLQAVQFGAFPNVHTWIRLRSTHTQPTHRQLSWRS